MKKTIPDSKKQTNSSVLILIVFFVIFLPGRVIDLTSIYYSGTPEYIRSVWLNYNFSILELLPIILSIFLINKSNLKMIYKILFIVIIINISRYFLGLSNSFDLNGYEMYLSFFTGLSMSVIISYVFKSRNGILKFFEYIMIANLISSILVITVGNDSFGRFYSIGQDLGTTAVLSVSYILIYSTSKKKTLLSNIAFISAFITLILSGSRYQISLLIILGLLMSLNYLKDFFTKSVNLKSFISLTIIFVFVIFLYFSYVIKIINQNNFAFIYRFFDTFLNLENIADIANDSSWYGRTLSIDIGLELISKNPLGLSNSFIDLQYNTQLLGYPNFTHSYAIIYFLLWGPISLLIPIFLIKNFFILLKKRNKTWVLCLYFLLLYIFYGSPIIFPKVYLWYIMIFIFIQKSSKEEIIYENNRSLFTSIPRN